MVQDFVLESFDFDDSDYSQEIESEVSKLKEVSELIAIGTPIIEYCYKNTARNNVALALMLTIEILSGGRYFAPEYGSASMDFYVRPNEKDLWKTENLKGSMIADSFGYNDIHGYRPDRLWKIFVDDMCMPKNKDFRDDFLGCVKKYFYEYKI